MLLFQKRKKEKKLMWLPFLIEQKQKLRWLHQTCTANCSTYICLYLVMHVWQVFFCSNHFLVLLLGALPSESSPSRQSFINWLVRKTFFSWWFPHVVAQMFLWLHVANVLLTGILVYFYSCSVCSIGLIYIVGSFSKHFKLFSLMPT